MSSVVRQEIENKKLHQELCKYIHFLYRKIHHKSSIDVDDIVQQTFIQALTNEQRFDPKKGSVLTWIKGIASTIIRAENRSADKYIKKINEMEFVYKETFFSYEPNVAIDLYKKIQDSHILTERENILLKLKLQNVKESIIATTLNINLKTVSSKYSKILAKLRRYQDLLDS